jgi:predicted amidohydrolase
MLTNLNGYKSVAATAQTPHSIFVFPEDGLYSPAFPDRDSILPYLELLPDTGAVVTCSSTSVLNAVACLAQTLNATVVVNMGELEYPASLSPSKSTNSSADPLASRKQYNTNIAVSPQGILLAKYRKVHLYYEPAFDPGDDNQRAFFRDPLSQKLYALLTCNDLLFQQSVLPLLGGDGQGPLEAILAPAWWVNLPPLLSGTAYFSGFSLAYNTTLAVAG